MGKRKQSDPHEYTHIRVKLTSYKKLRVAAALNDRTMLDEFETMVNDYLPRLGKRDFERRFEKDYRNTTLEKDRKDNGLRTA